MPNTGRLVRQFDTEHELSTYSLRAEKIMPKEDAHAGGILKYLLRHIIFPRNHNQGKGKDKGKNKPRTPQV